MPRSSKRAEYLRRLRRYFQTRMVYRASRKMLTSTDDDDDDLLNDSMDLHVLQKLRFAEERRYLFRSSKYRKGRHNEVFERDLDDGRLLESDDESIQPWLNDTEFLQKYRVSRRCFGIILDKIKDHPVFESKSNHPQTPVSHQLLTWLKYVGTEGSGASNSNQRNTFEIGYGTAAAFRSRVTTALRSLRDNYINWPTPEERKMIAREIFEEYGFPHCVSIADGTLFPLAFEPETEDAPDYSGRKYGYSLTTLIFCDHKRKIRHYLAGFPGSAHDNRVFRATRLYQNPRSYFAEREYSIGDSAFENTPFMVSAHKKPVGETLPDRYEKFNEKLARLRIISEHCIGLLKGRFPWLRQIRMKITEDRDSLTHILELLDATIVLHNMLIELREEEVDDWVDWDDFSDIDEAVRAPYEEGDVLNQAIPAGAPKDERRTRLMYYFEEHHYF
jgi:DDE superfamily endonuclease